ncbi:ABC transporter ATP-binding protein [Streptomyces sudanensis]|uniref:ABC transporter ATP-binding protein n=1 Tax=Streptomyces sudanensis TaxID=436397 RepID=UPI0020CF93F6|nr:ATP-binding cassette domain-containing protein [Streptomyces sudanensis]MCP9956966.1 ATP-binding cassette domain-containing protein [Streptomyces sudanensis]
MLQAIGLTSTPRRNRPPAVDDLTFQASPGQVTALLGPAGAGKTTALRLMLGLERGRGVTYFRGRPLHRAAHPLREVGTLLGDVPGHPARSVRGQLRMVCAVAGVPAARADDLIAAVGLEEFADRPLGVLSRGMDRRLGIATALLGDPHALVLDEPAAGLPPREAAWLHGVLRAHAVRGGTVLYTTADSREAARTADHVVAIRAGRLVADQDAAAFARTRLRPRVAVRTPHAARLASQLAREARAARRPVEAVAGRGNELYVYGSDCAEVGEAAFRHGILLHRLAEETGPAPEPDPAPGSISASPPPSGAGTESAAGWGPAFHPVPTPGSPSPSGPASASGPDPGPGPAPVLEPDPALGPLPVPEPGPAPGPAPALDSRPAPGPRATAAAPPPIAGTAPDRTAPDHAAPVRPVHRAARRRGGRRCRGPLRPYRYELRRLTGVASTAFALGGTVAVSVVLSVLLGRLSAVPPPVAVAAWPESLPLPPAALGAGIVGALSFGDEYRYPVLPAVLGATFRRRGLLLAKSAVTAGTSLLLAVVVAVVDLEALRLAYGGSLIPVPENWPTLCASWAALVVGCGWTGLLAAAVFRTAAAGVAAVLAVPMMIAPLVEKAFFGPAVRTVAGLPARLRELTWFRWPHEADRWLDGALRVVAQPVGMALTLSLTALLCAFLLMRPRGSAHWRSSGGKK